jgi:hypothetical protein
MKPSKQARLDRRKVDPEVMKRRQEFEDRQRHVAAKHVPTVVSAPDALNAMRSIAANIGKGTK